jgi:hypothetical protein
MVDTAGKGGGKKKSRQRRLVDGASRLVTKHHDKHHASAASVSWLSQEIAFCVRPAAGLLARSRFSVDSI